MAHPLTLPSDTPSTMYRERRKYMTNTTTGVVMAGMISGQ